jgi:hypothetical protein
MALLAPLLQQKMAQVREAYRRRQQHHVPENPLFAINCAQLFK